MKTRLCLSLKPIDVTKLLAELQELDDRSAAGIEDDYPFLSRLRDVVKEIRR